jgi:hypothetical protein
MIRQCSSRSAAALRAVPLGFTDRLFAVLIAKPQDAKAL